MATFGSKQARSTPGLFYHPDRGARAFIHGGDYVSAGKSTELEWIAANLKKEYECKVEVLGFEAQDFKQVKVFNRAISWVSNNAKDTIVYEAGPRHAGIIAKQFKLGGAQELISPMIKPDAVEHQR